MIIPQDAPHASPAAARGSKVPDPCPVPGCTNPARLYHGKGRYCSDAHKRLWERMVREAGETMLAEQLGLQLTGPIARTTDPVTSHIAAAVVTESGTREHQCQKVLRALRRATEPLSYREIHRVVEGMEAVAVCRRLDDLRDEGLAAVGPKRVCRISGRPVQTWYAVSATEAKEGQAA